MSWTKVEPINALSKRPMATMGVGLYSKLGPRLKIGLSAQLLKDYGGLETLDISLGDGEDADTLLLEFKKGGGFTLSRGGRGGATVSLPAPESVGEQARSAAPCKVVKFTPSSVIVHLPAEGWARQQRKARPAPEAASPPPPASPPPAPAPAPVEAGKPKVGGLDMVTYLEGKGRRASRISGGRYMVDGVAKEPEQALRMVNAHRQEAALPPLTLDKVW